MVSFFIHKISISYKVERRSSLKLGLQICRLGVSVKIHGERPCYKDENKSRVSLDGLIGIIEESCKTQNPENYPKE